MTARLLRGVGRAVVAGLLVAVLASQGDVVSFRVWFTTAAVVIVVDRVAHLLESARVEPATLAPAWWPFRRRRSNQRSRANIGELALLEGITRDALEHPRVYALRVRPRLQAIAEHHLPITRGIDVSTDTDRARTAMGELAWMLDPTVVDRTPTLTELERFLDLVEPNGHVEEVAHGR